jgi:Na+/phosphate symporter
MMNYFAHVLVRMIVGYVVFIVIAAIAFLGYSFISSWSDAVALALRLASNEIVSLVVWLPFTLAWFSDSIIRGKDPIKNMPLGTRELIYEW